MVGGLAARAVISGFARSTRKPGVFLVGDRPGTLIGFGLLAAPVLALAAASGRLGASRREQRLAKLRLAGATPRQILAMTGVEASVVGVVGSIAGAGAYVLLLPVLARVPYGVGAWQTGDLWTGPLAVAALVAAVGAVTAISAMSALRRVAVAPLGVAQQSDPRRTRITRLLFALAIAGFVVARAHAGGLGASGAVGLMLLFYGAYWTLGPWVVDRLGRIIGRLARRPATLLAARRLSDDPAGAWRTVSGLVLAGFVAGFCAVAQVSAVDVELPRQIAVEAPTATDPGTSDPGTSNPNAAGSDDQQAVDRLAANARDRLGAAGVAATVRANPEDSLLWAPGIAVQVAGGPAEVDAALTALTGVVPGAVPYTQDHRNADMDAMLDSLRQVGFAALVLGFMLATASAGLTAAATVLDRRRIYRLLRLAGTPLGVLDRARIWETALPLVVLAGGTTAAGVYAALKVNKMLGGDADTTSIGRLLGCLLIGAAAMLAAITASRPLLRAAAADPIRADD